MSLCIDNVLLKAPETNAKLRSFKEKYGVQITTEVVTRKRLWYVSGDYDVELRADDEKFWKQVEFEPEDMTVHVDTAKLAVYVYDVRFTMTRDESDEHPVFIETFKTIEIPNNHDVCTIIDSDRITAYIENEFVDEFIERAVKRAMIDDEPVWSVHIKPNEDVDLLNRGSFDLLLESSWFTSRLDNILAAFAKRLERN